MSRRVAKKMRLDVWAKDVVLTLDHASYVAVVNSYDPGSTSRDDVENTQGMCRYLDGDKKPIVIGWFNRDLATLVHECVHAACAVLDCKGVPIKLECDEAIAYTVDCLFSTLRKVKRKRA